MNPTSSFLRFTLGFLTFIGISFGITFAVGTYELAKSTEDQAAAAIQAMIES